MVSVRQIDLETAKDVYSLFNNYRVFYEQASNEEQSKLFIDDRLRNNQSIIYVAYDGETPVGFTQLYPFYSSVSAVKYWVLNDLFVDPNYRKNGIGRLLINKAIEFCSKDKGSALFLETAKNNFTAKKLYEEIGFQKEPIDSYYDKYKLILNN